MIPAAREWAQVMASEGGIRHRDDLAPYGNAIGEQAWNQVGENVGTSARFSDRGVPIITGLDQAFYDSLGHRDNVLGDYTHIAVGATESESSIFLTVAFADFKVAVANSYVPDSNWHDSYLGLEEASVTKNEAGNDVIAVSGTYQDADGLPTSVDFTVDGRPEGKVPNRPAERTGSIGGFTANIEAPVGLHEVCVDAPKVGFGEAPVPVCRSVRLVADLYAVALGANDGQVMRLEGEKSAIPDTHVASRTLVGKFPASEGWSVHQVDLPGDGTPSFVRARSEGGFVDVVSSRGASKSVRLPRFLDSGQDLDGGVHLSGSGPSLRLRVVKASESGEVFLVETDIRGRLHAQVSLGTVALNKSAHDPPKTVWGDVMGDGRVQPVLVSSRRRAGKAATRLRFRDGSESVIAANCDSTSLANLEGTQASELLCARAKGNRSEVLAFSLGGISIASETIPLGASSAQPTFLPAD